MLDTSGINPSGRSRSHLIVLGVGGRVLNDPSIVLHRIKHLTGNGTATNFRVESVDRCLDCGPLADCFGQRAINDLRLGEKVKVSCFISNGNWSLPSPSSPLLIEIFRIFQVSPSLAASFDDEVIRESIN